MKRRLRVVGAVVVVALLVTGAVALLARGHDPFGLTFSSAGGATTDWFGPATFDGKPLTCPVATSTLNGQPAPLGVPAITPRIAHPGPEQAAYSVADLRAYLLNTIKWSASEHVTIYSIQLMNAVHAAALSYDECTGLPDAAPVYFVTLHGDFPAVVGPPMGGTPRPTPPDGHVATIIYDAHTGYLIMAGNLGK